MTDDTVRPAEVIGYWFGDLTDGFADAAHRRRWFSASAAMDDEIRGRFGHLIDGAASGALDGWLESPTGTLAFILVCDQFSRQVNRGTAQAFATDPLALEVARLGIEQGRDRALALHQRAFFYMPFHHAESILDQHTAVGLYSALHEATPAARRQLSSAFLRSAREHRDVVLRFGRFPHRNRLLGRRSSAQEKAHLETAPRYGQG